MAYKRDPVEVSPVTETQTPHPYELGPRDGRWQRYGCLHCSQRPGAEIHNPALWDPDWHGLPA